MRTRVRTGVLIAAVLVVVAFLLVTRLGDEEEQRRKPGAGQTMKAEPSDHRKGAKDRRSIVSEWKPERLPEGGKDRAQTRLEADAPSAQEVASDRADPSQSETEGDADAAAIGGRFGGGKIEGRVTYAGPIPEPETLDMSKDPKCKDVASEEDRQRRKIVVGEKGGLAGAVVWVELAKGGSYPPPEEKVVLHQEGCRYHPGLVAIQVGQHLSIFNDDPLLHNVHAQAKRSEFNQAMPKQGQRIEKRFKRADTEAEITCEVHPWMHAPLFVFSHPFFAVTDASGHFSIDRLPGSGPWHLVVQHPNAGAKELPAASGKIEVHLGDPAL